MARSIKKKRAFLIKFNSHLDVFQLKNNKKSLEKKQINNSLNAKNSTKKISNEIR